jgi:hypothetical protein
LPLDLIRLSIPALRMDESLGALYMKCVCTNVVYKRVVNTSESSTPPNLPTSARTLFNNATR